MIWICQVDWQALATVAAGGLAVIGAAFVGRKQAEILRLQTEILKQQVESDTNLRKNDQRILLLEARQVCVERVQAAHSRFSVNVDLSKEERADLYAAIRSSELLFPEEIIEKLGEVLQKVNIIPAKYRLHDMRRRQGKEQ